MMYIINMVLGISCLLLVNILSHCLPDGEVRHVLVGVFWGAGVTACLNIIKENK